VGLFYNVRLADAYDSEASARASAEAALGETEAAKRGEEEARKQAENARDLAQGALQERDAALKSADRTACFRSVFMADLALSAVTCRRTCMTRELAGNRRFCKGRPCTTCTASVRTARAW
jgi:hypothetical protein